ncbi:hypothetical protein [Chromobacterium haemolyticum]|uniref:hypothetical protein n=1 Tax=Chromobacterium haemolyticum TaxID=394935 RepID=UPI001746EA20|nr:hypothetical protein [Chromobacterium haemolyticum]QOD80746.1 hypothetical protein IEZ30_12215 [Chromobacterium haemolyticum]
MKKALQKQGLFHDAEQDFMLWLSKIANFDYKISTFPISDNSYQSQLNAPPV